MEKKEVAEIRKLLSKKDCRIDKIAGSFVGEDGQVIAKLRNTWRAMQDDEVEKYCELFKKVLSGKLGRNLFNMSFPLTEELQGGKQTELYSLIQSQFAQGQQIDDFIQGITDSFQIEGRYLVLLAYGTYDIPAKTSDGNDLEDASDYVYQFMVCAICPVKEVKEGLTFDETTLSFVSRNGDLGVLPPVSGFLFPAFNDRFPDIHSLLYYAKKEDERHTELIDAVVGADAELPVSESDQQELFSEVVEKTLGRDCSFETVRDLSISLDEQLKQDKESGESAELGKTEVRRLLTEAGADRNAGDQLDRAFDEVVGEGKSLNADSIAGRSTMQIKSPSIRIQVKSEMAGTLETRVLGGREYLLIPIQDDVEVNGIRILPKRADEDGSEETDDSVPF